MPKAVGTPSAAARLAPFLPKLRPLTLAHAYERELLFTLTLGGVAFYYTALSAYAPLDPSWFVVAVPPAAAQNLAGAFGANLAASGFFAFGCVAWLLPLPFLSAAWLMLRQQPHATARSRLLGWALAFAGMAAFLALRVPHLTWRGFDLPSGGLLGLTVSTALLQWCGQLGSWIALATAAICAALLITRRDAVSTVSAWCKGDTLRRLVSVKNKSPGVHDAQAMGDDASEPTVFAQGLCGGASESAAEARGGSREPGVFAQAPAGAVALSEASPWHRAEAAADELDNSLSNEEFAATPAAAEAVKQRYAPPPLSVFNHADPAAASQINARDLEATAQLLVKTFADFGVQGSVIGYQPGPVVTVFEFQPDAGVKQSKVVGLIDDLALALKVDSIFIHPVRGKRALGVQVPNMKRELVHLGDILSTGAFRDAPSTLTFGLGKTISGQPMCADLAAMPHLLMAGATGSGKSVGINAMLCSIIMKATPDDVRMILVDPKMLELSIYEGIPHLLMPVITEPTKASLALQWAAAEMERRYKLMQHASVRNLAGFNEFWAKASPSRRAQLREAVGGADPDKIGKLPYILLVIDELADLMMTAPKDVEASIQRLAQKARASGIHMVLATQRPSVDIITGVIKANLPCRVAFQVVSKHDSRTILDLIGAEKLLGKGDMLLQRPGIGRLERLQGALITDEEVLNLVATVKASSPVHYDESIIAWIDEEYARKKDASKDGDESLVAMDDDPRWDEAVAIGQQHGVVSASFLQRHLKIGYNRAARIVEYMEKRGLVAGADGAKPRKWLGHRPIDP